MANDKVSLAIRTAKEVARHVLHKAGAKRKLGHLQPASRADRFDKIYADGVWRQGDPETPGSGRGSSLAATRTLRDQLPHLLDAIGARTLLDIGCGDFTWMQATPLNQHYHGVDLVPSVIETNRRLYSNGERNFSLCDAVEGELPDADVVLCREVLFHLSFADAKQLFRNALSKPRAYFICTSDGSTLFNSDIQSGDFRSLNLEVAPFALPPPERAIPDDSVVQQRYMGVWPASVVRSALRI